MAQQHYENFPVASVLLPKPLREPVMAIYQFARAADDIADEGEATDAVRLAGLEAFRRELASIGAGHPAQTPLFQRLQATIARHQLPLQPFYDLLDAFSQDVVKKRYADFPEVLDYCRRSANPVGLLLLKLYHADSPRNVGYSDAICSSLQLINFLQDIAIDWQKNRIYLPQDELQAARITEACIAAGTVDATWIAFMQEQVARARQMMLSGAPLGAILPGRIGLEMRMIIHGGLRILDKIEAVGYDVFHRRPVLGGIDSVRLLARALTYRAIRRPAPCEKEAV
jgi:squalene synthase HpnC